ncbi:MAG: EamA family transporter [Acidobacteria bacterium]|nr:EamA family transporter [Acidobacteriota bacterium]MCI0720389.1 EamA family transporter [Acidobacteriota bacterium]
MPLNAFKWRPLTAYVWLLKATTPARVSTYAYVNPVVAVFLGWLLAGEAVTPRMFLAAAIIIAAVFLIISRQGEARSRAKIATTQPTVEEGLCASK